MVGAGAAVTLSFVVASMFVKGDAGGRVDYWRHNLFSSPLLRLALMNPLTVFAIKAASVFLLGLVIAAGLFGSNISHLNWAPTFVWIIWWVGMGFVVALLGNVWAIANPWQNLYEGSRVGVFPVSSWTFSVSGEGDAGGYRGMARSSPVLVVLVD